MKTPQEIGVWMDHQNAHLIEFTTDPIQTITVQSKFTHQVKELSLHEGENRMHNKEKHQQAEYYNALGEILKDYSEVLIFGPTDAKKELHNILASDSHFAKIKITIRQADKMTENQQHAFVKDFFSEKHEIKA